jgi:hypothetical protein
MEPAEFAELNFDFHPAAVRDWLKALGFRIERTLTVSHFRWEPLKRVVPTAVLVWLDSCLQWTGAFWQLTPSVFLKASVANTQASHALADKDPLTWFRCAACGHWPLEQAHDWLRCPHCGARWGIQDGIYDFRHPVATAADVAA